MGSTGESKVAIVTGAASGIGESLTRDLVGQGWRVAGFDILADANKALHQELGDSFFPVHCELTDYDQQAAAFTQTFEKWGRIDALCANAGIVDRSSLYIFGHRGKTDIPPKPNLNSTETCYIGLIYGTQLAVHFMRQNRTPGGAIIATGSSVGIHPIGSIPEYCGAKAAVHNFVQATSQILKHKENITINCVCPGAVPTRNIPQAMRDSFGIENMTPLSTITAAYTRLLSDPSLNGQIIECSADRQNFVPVPVYTDGETLKRTTTIYEGLFYFVHGEGSGVEGVIV